MSQEAEATISTSYISTVHYLIERCLLLYMDRDDTVKALLKHANIKPAVTLIVWKELVKANGEFFEHYFKTREARRSRYLNTPIVLEVESSSSRSSSPILQRPSSTLE